jgi:stage V sporulation protein G
MWVRAYKYLGKVHIMNITDVRVRMVRKSDAKLKAVASIIIDDCFVVHDIKIIDGNEGYFIAMPSRKTPDGEFKDIAHPILPQTRKDIQKLILDAFEVAKSEAAASGGESAEEI